MADEGEGIPADALPRLFEPFERFATARHPEVDGSGLGLAFVKAAAERHNGRVAVESAPGRGSRFTLWVPAQAPPPDSQAGRGAAAGAASGLQGPATHSG